MADDELDFDRVDHEIRINELKERARELTGGAMHDFEPEPTDDPKLREIREAFWEHVVKVEEGGWVSSRQQLQAAGVALPSPEELTDEQLAAKLQEIIDRMAALRTYLYSTNHLSDRELYTRLWEDVLNDEVPEAIASSTDGHHIIDMLGSCSEQDIYLQFKYYADEDDRQHWLKEWPDYDMPPHEEPPYDRDRHLPRPPEEQGHSQRKGRPEDRPADIHELAEVLLAQTDEAYAFYDCDTGKTVSIPGECLRRAREDELENESWREPPEGEQEVLEQARAIVADRAARFVELPGALHIDEWGIMREFAEGLTDPAQSRRLLEVIESQDALRRFKDVIREAALVEQWSAFRDRVYHEIAREWCQWHNLPVKPEAPEESPGAA